MSAEANFDNRGEHGSTTPKSPLPPDILEILAMQQARMDELLEQERARCRQELAAALKAASKAQEGRIYEEMRRKVIDEELPRIRLLLKQQLTPLVMEELRAGNAKAALLPSEKQGYPRGLRRSSSEAYLDDEEVIYNQLSSSHGSKRVRTGPSPISMRRPPNMPFPSYPEQHFPSRSPRRNIIGSQARSRFPPLSRAARTYLPDQAIPSIETDGQPLTEEQLKDAGLCAGYHTRCEGFMPSNSDNFLGEIRGVDRPLTPFVRQDSVRSEDDSLPDKLTTPPSNFPAGVSVQDGSPHGIPPLRQPQEFDNSLGLAGRLPHGWYASKTDILEKTRDTFPHKHWGLSSKFRPLLVFYSQRHILIECEGLYFFWHEPTNFLERIDKPKELQEILKQMDHGSLLPYGTSIPTECSAPLRLMELVRADNLLYWSTPEIIHRRRSSIDRAVRQGLIRLGSESSIHESNANDLNERDEEDGDNPDALFSRYSDHTQGALDDRKSREPGFEVSSDDSNAQEAFSDHPAAIFTPSSSPSPLEEGATLNNPIDLISSSSSIQVHPTYTRSNSDRKSLCPDAYEHYWGDVQGASPHRESKSESELDEELDDYDVRERYYDWDMSHEGVVDWRAMKRQMRHDEEQYP